MFEGEIPSEITCPPLINQVSIVYFFYVLILLVNVRKEKHKQKEKEVRKKITTCFKAILMRLNSSLTNAETAFLRGNEIHFRDGGRSENLRGRYKYDGHNLPPWLK